MTHPDADLMTLTFHPVTPDRWPDLERLFGPHGANSGCWCLWWRLSRAEFDRSTADERKAGLKGLVDAGDRPASWPISPMNPSPGSRWAARISASLERSRVLKRVDDRPVWSIVCFFVGKRYRRQGLMVRLLQGAVGYAAANGAQIVEGYPVDPGDEQVGGGSIGFHGAGVRLPQSRIRRSRPAERAAGHHAILSRECNGMIIEQATQVTDELEAAFVRLMPQLSSSNPAPTRAQLTEMVTSPAITLLVAREPDAGGEIVGSLTLAMFRIPTGRRAWIEDVVVDSAQRGKGVGEALTREALRVAQEAGATTVDLTSRPSREAANRLYQRIGFEKRETNVYRYTLTGR